MPFKKALLGASMILFSTTYALADPLSDAVTLQKQAQVRQQALANVEKTKEQTEKHLNSILQSSFYKFYGEVKKSGFKLANAQAEVEKLNNQRRMTGGCCDILIAMRQDSGGYVITTEGDGLFAIDGYGLQSVNGRIQDEQYKQSGTLSNQCRYEVSLSYNNSKTYSCVEFASRKLDTKVVKDMLGMLPEVMKNYKK